MEREVAKQKFQEECFEPLFIDWTQAATEQYGRDYDRAEMLLLTYGKGLFSGTCQGAGNAGLPSVYFDVLCAMDFSIAR